MSNKFYFFLLILLFFTGTAVAQQQLSYQQTQQILNKKAAIWDLSPDDIADFEITNSFKSKHNGVMHVYVNQQYRGINIHNAITTINILPNGELLYATNRFLPNISERVNTTQARINPEMAIRQAAVHLEIPQVPDLTNKSGHGRNGFIFKNTNISNSDVKVEPIYQLMPDGSLHLAWQLAIDKMDNADFWNLRVDALTGKVLDKNNWTTHCAFGNHEHGAGCHFLENTNAVQNSETVTTGIGVDGAQYRVFAMPLESPAHGGRTLVVNPADSSASPFGWHDTDGIPGAEYTITRGNNVHAYTDPDDNNRSNNDEPDGGENLIFDYPFNQEGEPETYRDAAVTQLFYVNNWMHDFAAAYGFDEQSGNFQEKNYTVDFGERDAVKAEAQDGYNLAPTDVAYRGNANFSSPSDGTSGRMQMYVWERNGRSLKVNAPEEVSGEYETGSASFGADITETPVTGQVAVVDDGSSNGTLGCNELINAEEVKGKLAMIDRGICYFAEKAINAKNAGAIGVIICNYENSFVNMGAFPGFVDTLGIPVVSMRQSDCFLFKSLVNDGLEITLQSPPPTGPEYYDGDLDNGIIAHEYAHGISIRLTGGRGTSDCLNNDEQMGEGWSDFFTLVATARPGDTGVERRGIGNYVLRQQLASQGIRRFPYSTDMEICPLTYKDILATGPPHPLGEVWTAVLWDLYWEMSREYGWDEDAMHGSGGNNRAIQLVMDGMKMQACNPGFIDGRDAILAADQANYGGANQCLIWKVFARRGMGYSAKQGNNEDRDDMVEGFDVMPSCIKELKIAKTMTPVIEAGEEMEVTLTVTNHKDETLTALVLTDEIPQGASVNTGSLSGNVTSQNNQLLIEIPTLSPGEEFTYSYQLASSPANSSSSIFLDDVENGDLYWLPINVEQNDVNNIWGLQDVYFNSGQNAWHVANPTTETEQLLQLDELITIEGEQPYLRFSHRHDIDPGTDGGLIEISIDDGQTWEDLGKHIVRNPYIGPLAYTTLATPDLTAFWGDSDGFKTSWIDLSAYLGEVVTIRFRFGATEDDPNDVGGDYDGWFVDDIEFLNLVSYQSRACVTSSEGDEACTVAKEGGTFVETGLPATTSVADLEKAGLQLDVFPNPAGEVLNISLSAASLSTSAEVSLSSLQGNEVFSRKITINNQTQRVSFFVNDLPKGFYFVKIQTKEGIAIRKVALQ